MKRSLFIKKTCPAIILTILASQSSISCKKEEVIAPVVSDEEKNYQSILSTIGSKGFVQDKNKVHFNITNQKYAILSSATNFISDLDNGVLLLRKDDKTMLAFDNCCPHLGTRNLWSFAANKFTCSNHGNSFGISAGQTVSCSSNSTFGNLKSYPTYFYKNLVTVDFS